MFEWLRRRPTPPPKGTRPDVRMQYDGVLYDLTDDLEPMGEDETGFALWQVYGPAHLLLIATPIIEIRQPVPRETHVRLSLIGGPGGARFATREEITNGL